MMRLSGTIQSSKNNEPVVYAKIKISVQDKEIATVFTDEHGEYEYKTEEVYTGQNLIYNIEKDGFETKTFCCVIEDAQIQKKFLLRQHEIIEKGRTGYLIAGILISAVIILVIYFIQPRFTVNEKSLDFGDMKLNDKNTKEFMISKTGVGGVIWDAWTDKEWISFSPVSGTNNGNVSVTIYTPDNGFSPGARFNATFYVDSIGWFGKKEESIDVSFKALEDKYEPFLSVEPSFTKITVFDDALPENKLSSHTMTIKNEGNGTLYWSVRVDKAWIRLGSADKPKIRVTGIDNETVKFFIDFSGLVLGQDQPVGGIITVESNYDGKVKIYITLTRIDDTHIAIEARNEEWFLPRLFSNLREEAILNASQAPPGH